LAGALALVLVAGMTSPAFAGPPQPFECTILEGDLLSVQLPAGGQVTIPKNVECNDVIVGPTPIEAGECLLLGVGITISNAVVVPNQITFDETFFDDGLGGDEGHCIQVWKVTSVNGDVVILEQELWFNEPQVAGELLPIMSSALVIAGVSTIAVWMIPTVLGLAGVGVYLVKFRANKE
jgi:hypothetical protein